jgi:hypothetical protein
MLNRFKDEKEAFVEAIATGLSNTQLAEEFGINLRTVSRWKDGLVAKPRGVVNTENARINPDWCTDIDPDKRCYVITSATNDSELSQGFYQSLLHLVSELEAQLVVIPILYKNPDMFQKQAEFGLWPAKLAGRYINQDYTLSNYLTVIGSFSINATAKRPLNGLNGVSGKRSAIIGSPKLDQAYHPYGLTDLPRSYTCTGSITLPAYSASKAGGIAASHHHLGATLVEIADDNTFHIRQIEFRNGSIHDITGVYTPTGKLPKARLINTVALGDVHIPFHDGVALDTAWGFLDTYRPRSVICHDFIDASAVSHHDDKKGLYKNIKEALGGRDLFHELKETYEIFKAFEADDRELVVPISNHHEHLERWLLEKGPKDSVNLIAWAALFPAFTAQSRLDNGEFVTPNLFKIAMEYVARVKQASPVMARFLEPGEEYASEFTDFSLHGHLGPGGSRGSLAGFARAVRQIMVGHSHTPGRMGHVLQIPTLSKLNRQYKAGTYNTWVHGIGVEYDNGAMTNINFIRGKYRP